MIKKYIKTAVSFLISLIILILILNTLYYFNIISLNIFNILRLIISLLIIFLTGRNLGKKVTKNGYLEGMKLGLFIILLFFSSSLLFKVDFSIKVIIYYIILFSISVIGSMNGINAKKTK